MTLEELRAYDSAGVYETIKNVPDQWREGRERALAVDWKELAQGKLRNVVVVGMGGSAIGGDLLRTLAAGEAVIPVFVSRGYRLPAWVGTDTLAIVSSYSGNTEEALCAMDEALRRNASVVCITSGGTVLSRAREQGLPHAILPGGMQPRAALGYALPAILTLAEHVGLIDLGDASWSETQAYLDAARSRLADPLDADNPALELAESLMDRLAIIYSSEGLLEAVNLRWRTQLHENSKTLAVGNLFPELTHNEIMGWHRRTDLLERCGVVVLRDREDHPQVQRRIDVTRELLAERAGAWKEVWSEGRSRLTRMVSLVYLGDWVSLYLAALHRVDPTPIGLITRLKESLIVPDSVDAR